MFVALGCGGSGARSAREQDLEVRLAKAEAALAEAQADTKKAKQSAGDSSQSDDAHWRYEAAQAIKDAQEAEERVEKLMLEMEAFDKRINDAVEAVTAAQSDADRAAATAKLRQLQKEQVEMKQRAAAARAAAEKAQRRKGTKISEECQDNPLAKNCM